MLIDWFTVGAQALNFLVLVWLLKRFLYKPILAAIDARESRVAAELADADRRKAEAKAERDTFQAKNEAFDRERAALLGKAVQEAAAERQRLFGEAREAADALAAKRQEALHSDAQALAVALRRRTQHEVFAIARKALADLATTSLEERAGEVFIRRLREMDGPAKTRLGEALETSAVPAIVRSAFDLPADQRAAIQTAINETFSADIHLQFETAADVVGGIELSANGQKVAWSITQYLASLEQSVNDFFEQRDQSDSKVEPATKAEAGPEPQTDPAPEAKSRPDAGSMPAPETGRQPEKADR